MGDATDKRPLIVWFRQDLRLADNPALAYATECRRPVVAIYVHDELSPGLRLMGAAQKWWLHGSLKALSSALQNKGVRLIFRSGAAADVLSAFADQIDAAGICWNRRYGEGEQSVDTLIKQHFKQTGLEARSFGGLLMHEPSTVRTGSDKPYRVYTPFWKKFCSMGLPRAPLPMPENLVPFDGAENIESASLDDWRLLPTAPDWSTGISNAWTPGEDAAQELSRQYLQDNLQVYDTARDLPGPDRTSRLSPHLRFGEISPHQLWHQANDRAYEASNKAREVWCKELVWREFSYHLLQEWPDLQDKNFNEGFDTFPWQSNPDYLKAWKQGQTGYPIIDAGMRQLWQTGWMHNRVRMIVASFLVKHLLIDWREGERWFWDTLVDGDPASNPAQWQWVAGSGADAAPYFRIFNPIMQAEKFDPEGTYIHRYVPEMARLPARYLPAPWDAPASVLEEAGVVLGETYPHPIVDHKKAREKALAALDQSKQHLQ